MAIAPHSVRTVGVGLPSSTGRDQGFVNCIGLTQSCSQPGGAQAVSNSSISSSVNACVLHSRRKLKSSSRFYHVAQATEFSFTERISLGAVLQHWVQYSRPFSSLNLCFPCKAAEDGCLNSLPSFSRFINVPRWRSIAPCSSSGSVYSRRIFSSGQTAAVNMSVSTVDEVNSEEIASRSPLSPLPSRYMSRKYYPKGAGSQQRPSGGEKSSSLAEQLQLSNLNGVPENFQKTSSTTYDRSKNIMIDTFRPRNPSLKEESGRVLVDRWVKEGSTEGPKSNYMQDCLQRLKNADLTTEGVAQAMEGWEFSITPKDISSILSTQTWRKAYLFFRWLKERNYEVNVFTYNVLLSVIRAGKQLQLADEVAEEMIREGVELDNYTYSTLISCASQCKAPLDSLKWFDRMNKVGCVPDEVTTSSMILVYGRLGRYTKAADLYEDLRKVGWIPDKVTYGTMVNVYARAGMYQEAIEMIREMRSRGYRPDAVVYNTLIRFFAREGKSGQAKRVFREMTGLGVVPTEYTLSLMIDVYGRAGNVADAFQLFAKMKEDNLPLDIIVYNSLLKMCGEERLVKEAEEVFAEVKVKGLRPDEVTYKSLMNVYAREGKVDDAVDVFDQLVEAGFTPDVVVYSCLMKACRITKEFKRAEEFFGNMLDSECLVDDRCCGVLLSLLNVCVDDNQRKIIYSCLERAKPTLAKTVEALIDGEAQFSVLDDLMKAMLLDSSRDSHRPFCNSLIDICWNLGHVDQAQSVLQIADSLGAYVGGLQSQSPSRWVLHLRSLSFGTAHCALQVWISCLQSYVGQGKELPETLIIETGVAKSRIEGNDEPRLQSVIVSRLKELSAPFSVSEKRADWLVSTCLEVTTWLTRNSAAASILESNTAPAAL